MERNEPKRPSFAAAGVAGGLELSSDALVVALSSTGRGESMEGRLSDMSEPNTAMSTRWNEEARREGEDQTLARDATLTGRYTVQRRLYFLQRANVQLAGRRGT